MYCQVADAIERDVYAGLLKPGQKMPTHRDLADALEVNVSTVTRGYREAEKRGLVSGTVGRGTFISSAATTVSAMTDAEPHAPGLLELGLIYPLYSRDPDMSAHLAALSRSKNLDTMIRYSDPTGLPAHRQAGVEWLKRFGLDVGWEEVVVCSGAQHALTCSLVALLKDGDRVAVDGLTYPGLKSLAKTLGLRLVPVEMDREGMLPESLDAACRRSEIKALYLVPGYHNPTTSVMPGQRRDVLAETAARHGLTLIEDDTYSLTVQDENQPVSARMPGQSVFIAGVSKYFWAGARISFVWAGSPLVKKLTGAILNTVWQVPALCAELISRCIWDGTADRTIQAKIAASAARYEVAERILKGLEFQGRPSGYFIWLELPSPLTGKNLEARARAEGINIFCAEKFAVGNYPAPQAVRLSLSGPDSLVELKRGLNILRGIIDNPEPDQKSFL